MYDFICFPLSILTGPGCSRPRRQAKSGHPASHPEPGVLRWDWGLGCEWGVLCIRRPGGRGLFGSSRSQYRGPPLGPASALHMSFTPPALMGWHDLCCVADVRPGAWGGEVTCPRSFLHNEQRPPDCTACAPPLCAGEPHSLSVGSAGVPGTLVGPPAPLHPSYTIRALLGAGCLWSVGCACHGVAPRGTAASPGTSEGASAPGGATLGAGQGQREKRSRVVGRVLGPAGVDLHWWGARTSRVRGLAQGA